MPDLDKPAADVFTAAQTRRSIRAYKPDCVDSETVREIVALARYAPSGSNIQPWRVHVLTGATLKRVTGAMQHAFLSDEPGHHRDYDYYTDPIYEPYLERRRQCGWGLYGMLGIGRGDREKSKAYRATNYNFLAHPSALFLLSIASSKKEAGWTTACFCRRSCLQRVRAACIRARKPRSRVIRTSCGASSPLRMSGS